MPTSLGDTVTLEALSDDPYPVLAELRALAPVAWVPVLDGWLVTSRDLCIQVMRDAQTYTVDDPRFSTGQVVGPSMLSLDGDDHRRHRDPFAEALRLPQVRERFTAQVAGMAESLVEGLAPAGRAEIRRDLAGPLAVLVVAALLELPDVEPATLLGWYDAIVASVDRISAGGDGDHGGKPGVRRAGSTGQRRDPGTRRRPP